MSKCKKCNNRLLTVSGFISEFTADQEPYESGVLESHDGITSEVYLTGEFCEKCELFLNLEIQEESMLMPFNQVDSVCNCNHCGFKTTSGRFDYCPRCNTKFNQN